MKNPSLLSLVPLLLAVLLPVAAAMPAVIMMEDVLSFTGTERPPYIDCTIGDGVYAANSSYEANLRRVAVLLVAEASTNRGGYHTTRTVGYWPNRLVGTSSCRWRHDDGDGTAAASSSCAACIAGAFLEVRRSCPYRREAFFSSRNCTLQLDEYRIFGAGGIFGPHSILEERSILEKAMASGLIFQAIGFAWLFFLLLQEWRSRKRGTFVHSAPVSPED